MEERIPVGLLIKVCINVCAVRYMPCGTKLSSNKNAKSDLTWTPDNLKITLIILLSSPSIEYSADRRAYLSTGINVSIHTFDHFVNRCKCY